MNTTIINSITESSSLITVPARKGTLSAWYLSHYYRQILRLPQRVNLPLLIQ